jgi:hypothetical protein
VKLGFAADNWLFYATGGVAVTDLHYDEVFIDNTAGAPASEKAGLSKVKTGWTAGAVLKLRCQITGRQRRNTFMPNLEQKQHLELTTSAKSTFTISPN